VALRISTGSVTDQVTSPDLRASIEDRPPSPDSPGSDPGENLEPFERRQPSGTPRIAPRIQKE